MFLKGGGIIQCTGQLVNTWYYSLLYCKIKQAFEIEIGNWKIDSL